MTARACAAIASISRDGCEFQFQRHGGLAGFLPNQDPGLISVAAAERSQVGGVSTVTGLSKSVTREAVHISKQRSVPACESSERPPDTACVAAASSAAAASRPPTAKEPIWASVDAAAAGQKAPRSCHG